MLFHGQESDRSPVAVDCSADARNLSSESSVDPGAEPGVPGAWTQLAVNPVMMIEPYAHKR